jgi:hypothetical protein
MIFFSVEGKAESYIFSDALIQHQRFVVDFAVCRVSERLFELFQVLITVRIGINFTQDHDKFTLMLMEDSCRAKLYLFHLMEASIHDQLLLKDRR